MRVEQVLPAPPRSGTAVHIYCLSRRIKHINFPTQNQKYCENNEDPTRRCTFTSGINRLSVSVWAIFINFLRWCSRRGSDGNKLSVQASPHRDVRMLELNNTTSRSNVIVTPRQNRGLAGKQLTPAVHVGQRTVNITIVDERQRGECMIIPMKVS